MPRREPTPCRALPVPCRQGQVPTFGFQLMLLVGISRLPWSDGKGMFHIALLHPSTVTITQVKGGSLGIMRGCLLGAGCGPSVALLHHSLTPAECGVIRAPFSSSSQDDMDPLPGPHIICIEPCVPSSNCFFSFTIWVLDALHIPGQLSRSTNHGRPPRKAGLYKVKTPETSVVFFFKHWNIFQRREESINHFG